MSSCPHDEHVISSISPRRTRGHQADEHVINSISPTRTRRAAMARAAAAFLGALACLLRIETMAWVCGARQKIGIVNGCGTERLHVYVGESRKKRVGSGTEIQSVGVRNTLGWGWQVDELRGQLAVHSRRRDRAFFFPGKMFTQRSQPRTFCASSKRRPP